VYEIPPMFGNTPQFPPTFAVGAFDLAAYHDSFLNDKWEEHFVKGEDTGPRGLFNYHWPRPGDPLAPLDLAAIASQINEQSKRDYAQLQTVSGMYRLAHLAAWLRFLSTPPESSQTVSGSTHDSRAYVSQEPTIAKSPKIFPATEIEAPAT